MARAAGHATYAWCALSSDDAGGNRALASNAQEPHPARELLSARRSRSSIDAFRRVLQPRRYHESIDNSPRPTSTSGAVKPSCWKEKGSNARPSKPSVASPQTSRVTSTMMRQTSLGSGRLLLKISDDGHAAQRTCTAIEAQSINLSNSKRAHLTLAVTRR